MAPARFVIVDMSSQLIGEPEPNVWCATCNLPSAFLVNLALMMTPAGVESYEVDPVVSTVTMHVCEICGSMFEMPDSPVLRGSRDD